MIVFLQVSKIMSKDLRALIRCIKNGKLPSKMLQENLQHVLPSNLMRKLRLYLKNDGRLSSKIFIEDLEQLQKRMKQGGDSIVCQPFKFGTNHVSPQQYDNNLFQLQDIDVSCSRLFNIHNNTLQREGSNFLSNRIPSSPSSPVPILGKGSFGVVYDIDNFAFKMINRTRDNQDKPVVELLKALESLKSCSQANNLDCSLQPLPRTTFICLEDTNSFFNDNNSIKSSLAYMQNDVSVIYKMVKCHLSLKDTFKENMKNMSILNDFASKFPFRIKDTYFVHGDIKNENIMIRPSYKSYTTLTVDDLLLTDLDNGILFDKNFACKSQFFEWAGTPFFCSPLYMYYVLELHRKRQTNNQINKLDIPNFNSFKNEAFRYWNLMLNSVLSQQRMNTTDPSGHIDFAKKTMEQVCKVTFDNLNNSNKNIDIAKEIISTSDKISIQVQHLHNIEPNKTTGGSKNASINTEFKCPKVRLNLMTGEMHVYSD